MHVKNTRFPERGKDPIGLPQGVGASDLGSLLPLHRCICSQSTLSLKKQGLLVDHSGQNHLPVKIPDGLITQLWFQAILQVPVWVKDPEHLSFEGIIFFNHRLLSLPTANPE